MSYPPSSHRIGIVGVGMIGEALARLCTRARYSVKIANSRGPETLADIAERTGAAAATVQDAVKDAQVVVVTIPQKNVPQLGEKQLISQLPKDTIVIDTGNYYPFRDDTIGELEGDNGTLESRWVEKQLGRPVIKVFNNIYFHSLAHSGKPAGTPGRVALPVAGDNAEHRNTVIALLVQIGFDGVDAGGLDDSWRQQPGTPAYGCDFASDGVKKGLSKADRSRSHAIRDLHITGWQAAQAAGQSHDDFPLYARQVMAEQYGEL